MNLHAVRAIYVFEMSRTVRTLLQSVISPVISTSLYFVVFGAAIGSRITAVEGVSYGAFIVPGLIMLTVLTQSIANASFAIYFPKFTGMIYEVLSAPVSYFEVVLSYVGAAATKSFTIGLIILLTSNFFVTLHIEHPFWMVLFLALTAVTFSLFGFIIGIWADGFEEAATDPAAGDHAADLPWRQFLFDRHAAAGLADGVALQSGGVSGQRLSLGLLRHRRRQHRGQPRHDVLLPGRLPRRHRLDIQDGLPAEELAARATIAGGRGVEPPANPCAGVPTWL